MSGALRVGTSHTTRSTRPRKSAANDDSVSSTRAIASGSLVFTTTSTSKSSNVCAASEVSDSSSVVRLPSVRTTTVANRRSASSTPSSVATPAAAPNRYRPMNWYVSPNSSADERHARSAEPSGVLGSSAGASAGSCWSLTGSTTSLRSTVPKPQSSRALARRRSVNRLRCVRSSRPVSVTSQRPINSWAARSAWATLGTLSPSNSASTARSASPMAVRARWGRGDARARRAS